MKKYCIELDDEFAKEIGFTSDLFGGYFWRIGCSIWVSLIISKHPEQRNFKRLMEKILSLGFVVKIPIPSPRLKRILIKNNYKHKKFYDKETKEYIEFWEKRPNYSQNKRVK